jgi:uncharacterized protein YbjT (DUF2867 family)
MFVVVGATGNTGSSVVETLRSKNQPVRVVVRSAEKGADWKAKGVEVAVASLDDGAALSRALDGAHGAYLLVPPSYDATAWLADQRARMDRAAEAVKKSTVQHIVFLSSIGAQLPAGTGPIQASHYGEQALGTVAEHMTVLRPCYFMDNWTAVIGTAKEQGVLPTFIEPSAKIPMISTKDIGRIGAEQLIAGGRGKQIVELAGPEEYSPGDVAAALSRLLGKKVTTQHAQLSAVVPTFKSYGFSDEAARLFEEMYTAFSKEAIGYEHPDKLVRGNVPLTEALRRML